MIDLILNILKEQDISVYLINECTETSEEAFFIRQKPDMKRAKNITKYIATLYRDFPKTEDMDTPMRGFASCILQKSMNRQELFDTLRNTYESAAYAKNPYFPLAVPEKEVMTRDNSMDSIPNVTMEQCIQALFAADTDEQTFLNSAELFITTTDYRIINSSGVDVAFSKRKYSGEFVVQSILSEDVEIYEDFEFSDSLPTNSVLDIPSRLTQLVSDTLHIAKDRSTAVHYPETAEPSVIILDGYCVAELFDFFLERCDASMIYPKYSDYTIGTPLPLKKESLNLTLKTSAPYTLEGIPLQDTTLIQNNQILSITGDSRFSYYLGIPALGTFSDFEVSCGSKSVEEFKKGACLRIVNFSDFQMNSLSGQFGGEFRLAYYTDEENNTIPVTGGSISGNILDILETLMISREELNHKGYRGARAVCYSI